MPPKIRRFGHLVAESSDDDSTAPVRAPQSGPAAPSSTSVSDVFSSSTSSVDETPHDGNDDGVTPYVEPPAQHRHLAELRNEDRGNSVPPSASARLSTSASRSVSRLVDGPGGSSPHDHDVGSSAFRDCYSPTATLATSPSQMSPPARVGAATLDATAGRANSCDTQSSKTSPPDALFQRSPIEVKPFRHLRPPSPSASSRTTSRESSVSSADRPEVVAAAAAPALQGHVERTGVRPVNGAADSVSSPSGTTRSGTVAPRVPDPSRSTTMPTPSADAGSDVPEASVAARESVPVPATAAASARVTDGTPVAPSIDKTSDSYGSGSERSDDFLHREDDPPNDAAQASVDMVNVSAPTTVGVTDHESGDERESVGTDRDGTRRKRSDSGAWASSRRTALDQLRAELAKTGDIKRDDVPPPGSMAAAPVALSHLTPPKAPPRSSPGDGDAAATIQEERTPSTQGSPSPAPAGFRVTPSKFVETATSMTGPNISGISGISPDRNPEVASILLENPDLIYGGTSALPPARASSLERKYHPSKAQQKQQQQQPSSSVRLGMSPVNRSGTVTPPRAFHTDDHRTGTPVSLSVSRDSTPHQRTVPLYQVSPDAAAHLVQQQQQRRWNALQEERDKKEMTECTFRPRVSPGSQHIMEAKKRAAKLREDEMRAAQEEEEAARHPPRSGPSSVPAKSALAQREPPPRSLSPTRSLDARSGVSAPDGVSSVYERLYPPELSEAQRKRQVQREEQTFRAYARKEMADIRAHLGATVTAPDGRTHDLANFLTNVLRQDCRDKAPSELARSGVFVSTPYQSPMSVAMREEKALGNRGKGSVGVSLAPTETETRGSSDMDSREYRTALFDEFLLRQNAHYFNRARTIRQIAEYTTPEFKPQINAKSTTLVKSMVQRSMLETTTDPETTTMIQEYRKRGIPVSDRLVKKHQSKYKDPCTFAPEVSPLADRSRGGHDGHNVTGAHQKRSLEDTYRNLYRDSARQQRAKEAAKQRAEKEALEGCTFAPKTNRKRNESAQSLFHPTRAAEYSNYLRSRREAALAKRKEELRAKEEEEQARAAEKGSNDGDTRTDCTSTEELAACTFKPRTTKTPAYITKMANSFGLVRKMDVEF